MFKSKLIYIMKDLNGMQSRNDAFKKCVLRKLDFSLGDYSKDIERICDYLLSRSNYKVIKNIAKK